jgi:hypothetical protein
MRDFSDRVGQLKSRNRFPFDLMTEIGDMFTAPDVTRRVMSSIISTNWQGLYGRRFATFEVGDGVRVFLVDIVDCKQSRAA